MQGCASSEPDVVALRACDNLGTQEDVLHCPGFLTAGFVNAAQARSDLTSGSGRFRFLIESRHLGSGGISSPGYSASERRQPRLRQLRQRTCLRSPGSSPFGSLAPQI